MRHPVPQSTSGTVNKILAMQMLCSLISFSAVSKIQPKCELTEIFQSVQFQNFFLDSDSFGHPKLQSPILCRIAITFADTHLRIVPKINYHKVRENWYIKFTICFICQRFSLLTTQSPLGGDGDSPVFKEDIFQKKSNQIILKALFQQ